MLKKKLKMLKRSLVLKKKTEDSNKIIQIQTARLYCKALQFVIPQKTVTKLGLSKELESTQALTQQIMTRLEKDGCLGKFVHKRGTTKAGRLVFPKVAEEVLQKFLDVCDGKRELTEVLQQQDKKRKLPETTSNKSVPKKKKTGTSREEVTVKERRKT